MRFEGLENDEYHVAVMPSLSKNESTIPVCVYNLSRVKVTLPAGYTLVQIDSVEVVCTECVTDLTLSFSTRVVSSQVEPVVPDHLKQLYDECIEDLTVEQCQMVASMLAEFGDVFCKDEYDLGEFALIQHTIDNGEETQVRHRIRHTPLGFQKEEENHLEKMLSCGVIQPSSSGWASAPVLTRKKCGSGRYCIDYRDLNKKTKKDTFPLPKIECLDTLQGSQLYSTLDLASGYYQVLLDPHDRHKTAFITKYGLFEHVRMGFGLCNAPATFQRVMNLVLSGLLWKNFSHTSMMS